MTLFSLIALFTVPAFAQDVPHCETVAKSAGFEACPEANRAHVGFGFECTGGCEGAKLAIEVRRCEAPYEVVGSDDTTEASLEVRVPNVDLAPGNCFAGWLQVTEADGTVGEWTLLRREYGKPRMTWVITKRAELVVEPDPPPTVAAAPPTDDFDQWLEGITGGADAVGRQMDEDARRTDEVIAGIDLTEPDPEPEPGLRAPPPIEPITLGDDDGVADDDPPPPPEDDGWGEPTVLTADDPSGDLSASARSEYGGGIPLHTVVRDPICEVMIQYDPGDNHPTPEDWERMNTCLQEAAGETGGMNLVYVDCGGTTDELPYSDLAHNPERDASEQGGLAAVRTGRCTEAAKKAGVDPNLIREMGKEVHLPLGQRYTILRAYDGPPQMQVITPEAIAAALPPPAPKAGPCDWVLETHPADSSRTVAGDVNGDGEYNAQDCAAAIDERVPEPAAPVAAVDASWKGQYGVWAGGHINTYGWTFGAGPLVVLPLANTGNPGLRLWGGAFGATSFQEDKPVNRFNAGWPPIWSLGGGAGLVVRNFPFNGFSTQPVGVDLIGLRLDSGFRMNSAALSYSASLGWDHAFGLKPLAIRLYVTPGYLLGFAQEGEIVRKNDGDYEGPGTYQVFQIGAGLQVELVRW